MGLTGQLGEIGLDRVLDTQPLFIEFCFVKTSIFWALDMARRTRDLTTGAKGRGVVKVRENRWVEFLRLAGEQMG